MVHSVGRYCKKYQSIECIEKIYNEGIANPYTPPEFTVKLSPVSGSEEATEDGEWVTNTYQFTSSMDRDYWKFRILGDDLSQMVESGSIEVYAGGTKLSLQPMSAVHGMTKRRLKCLWDRTLL